jgi:nicotinamidase-related amidase
VVVDVQTRLAAAMAEDDRTRVLHNLSVLLDAARALEVPVVATAQYPKGLGPIESAVSDRLPEWTQRVTKTSFSCCPAEGFLASLEPPARAQVVLAGMEAHVCVLQTALDLQGEGYQVFVVEDAVCSRDPHNHRNALERLRQGGVVVTNTESVVFEWLGDARHPRFKAVSALLK